MALGNLVWKQKRVIRLVSFLHLTFLQLLLFQSRNPSTTCVPTTSTRCFDFPPLKCVLKRFQGHCSDQGTLGPSTGRAAVNAAGRAAGGADAGQHEEQSFKAAEKNSTSSL